MRKIYGGGIGGSIYFERCIRHFIISFNIRKKFKADFTSKNALPIILDDIEKYRASYIDTIFQENLIGSRFKSEDSIKRKYVYKYKNPEIGYQLYRKYVDGKIKNKEEFLKNLKEME